MFDKHIVHAQKFRFVIGAALMLYATTSLAQDERRQLGPHQHGHGTLNIAIEGNRVDMDLDVPSADLVGFEHAPATAAEKAAADRAATILRDAASLFVMPAAAGCRVENVRINLEQDAEPGPAGTDTHADYNVEFAFTCATPAALIGITFAYFDKFPGAAALSVNIAISRGQSRFEVTRATPRLENGRLN